MHGSRGIYALLLLLIFPAIAGSGPPPPGVLDKLQTGLRATGDAAVVIGIEKYAFLPEVPYAERDAEAFYRYLVYTRGVPATRVNLLTGSPTAKEMRESVRQAAGQVSGDGILWVYFAGHGAAHPKTGKRILLGVDVQGKVGALEEEAYALQLDEMDSLLEGASPGQTMVVVDACFAGTGRGGKQLIEGKRLAVPAYAMTPRPQVTVWSATSADELSGPFEDAKHGLFTYFLVGALRGWADGEIDGQSDGQVTLGEAQQYVFGAVRTIGGGEQNPTQEKRNDLLATPLTPTSNSLERGPDLAELTLGQRGLGKEDKAPEDKPTKPDKPAAESAAAVVSGGGDYMAKLAELQRLQDELAQMESARTEKMTQARQQLQQEATDAWVATQPLLEQGGPIAEQAARMFIDMYGSASVTMEDLTERVKIPEVDKARDWLASLTDATADVSEVQYEPEAYTETEMEPAGFYLAEEEAPAELTDLLMEEAWRYEWAADSPLGRRLVRKAKRDEYNDEVWGDAGDKAMEHVDTALATYLYLHAAALDPSDSEWQTGLLNCEMTEIVVLLQERRVAEYPDNDEVLGDYGDILSSLGRTDEACAAYRRAAALDPADAEWQNGAAGCPDQGSALFTPTASVGSHLGIETRVEAVDVESELDSWASYDSDAAALKASLDAEPTNDELWGDLGDLATSNGRTALAIGCYQRAYEYDPADLEWQRRLLEEGAGEEILAALGEAALNDSDNDERLGDFADALMHAGFIDDACAMYQAAMEVDPADTEWPDKLLGCMQTSLLVSGTSTRVDTSASLLEQVAELASSDETLDNIVASLRGDQGNDELWGDAGDQVRMLGYSDLALNCFRQAFFLQPSDSEWQGKVGELAGREGLFTAFEQAIASDSSNDELIGDYGDALDGAGRRAEACEAWSLALSLEPADSEWIGKVEGCGGAGATPTASSSSGVDAALAAHSAEPTDETAGAVGEAYLAAGDRETALRWFQDALIMDPVDVQWSWYVLLWGNETRVQMLQRLAPASGSDEVYGDLGDHLLELNRDNEARQAYERAASIDPFDTEWAYKQLVLTRNVLPAAREAVVELEAAMSLTTPDDEMWGDLGDALLTAGRRSDACDAYRQAATLDPEDTEWVTGQERCLPLATLVSSYASQTWNDDLAGAIAMGYVAQDDWANASLYFRKALDADPTDTTWMMWTMALSEETLVGLLEQQTRSVDTDELWGNLGDAYMNEGRQAEAISAWQSALALDPTDSEWTNKLSWFNP